jgi:hypothetical protein
VPVAPIAARVARHARIRGLAPVVADCLTWGVRRVLAGPGTRTPGTFVVDGTALPYFRHGYHYTWLNERAVEIPLAEAALDAAGTSARVLEVGNVLGHYRPVTHTVVDKYERSPGVRNVDVVDIGADLAGPYDLILAVSTLEHVGLDEAVQDPEKPARAIAHLTSLLAPGGRLWCTFPVGYNPALDERLRDGRLGFDRLTALRRTGRANRWEQVPVDDVWGIPYDRLLYTAHAIVVAESQR